MSAIPWFPLDVHLDDKFDLIEAEFGLIGFSVIIKLFQKIYGGFGYYCEWTNDVALLFAKKLGFKPGNNVVSEIVSAAVKRGIFNRELYERYRILTSKGIQDRYLKAAKRRKEVTIKKEYLLIKLDQKYVDADILYEDVCTKAENENILEQRREEERREENIREEESTASPPSPEKQVLALFKEHCPSYTQPKKLSQEVRNNLRRLISKYSLDDIQAVFAKAESSRFLQGKTKGGWRAAFDWIIREDNFIKILNGNYDDSSVTDSQAVLNDDFCHDDMEALMWARLNG